MVLEAAKKEAARKEAAKKDKVFYETDFHQLMKTSIADVFPLFHEEDRKALNSIRGDGTIHSLIIEYLLSGADKDPDRLYNVLTKSGVSSRAACHIALCMRNKMIKCGITSPMRNKMIKCGITSPDPQKT
jgi:hypothetical protein